MNGTSLSKLFSLNFIFSLLQSNIGEKNTKKTKKKVRSNNKLKAKPKSVKKIKRTKKPVKRSVKRKTKKEPKKIPLKKIKLLSKATVEKAKKIEKKEKSKDIGIGKGKTDDEVPEQLKWLQEDPHELLLSRFIESPKGVRLGESIGIDGSNIIMKNKTKFYSISLKAIKEKGDALILRKKINWKLAEKLGEKWRKKTLDVIEVNKSKYSKVIKIE
jgi:hypothetical protein